MHELRIHGRGGQGAVAAAAILATALIQEGRDAMAIPAFGFERRGAPVAAFLRFDDKPIRRATNIYHPDFVICIDPTLPAVVDIFGGLQEGGTLVQATRMKPGELAVDRRVRRIGLCDAVGIAQKIFARPITNTIMLGAFARTTGLVSLAALIRALEQSDLRDAHLQQNLDGLAHGFEETMVYDLPPEAAQ